MEDDDGGGCEVGLAGDAKTTPPTYDVDCPEFAEVIRYLEAVYGTPEGHPWRDEGLLYSLYYRDQLTEKEKTNFFKIPASELDYFCSTYCGHHGPFWLRNMLADAVMFFKLYNTWKVYICPISECLCWFSDDNSLVLHLMREHRDAWPFLTHRSTEERWFSEALRSTVWKPIDVRVALNKLSTTYSHLSTNQLVSLGWPLSEDSSRSKLLEQLQKGFEVLLGSPEGNSSMVCSSGCLRAINAVASKDLLVRIDPMNNLPLPFRNLLDSSLISFCFMEEESLRRFVGLVEDMCRLIHASQNRESEGSEDDDVHWSKSECLDAVSFSADCDDFVLDGAKLNMCGLDEKDMGLWLFKASNFPTIKKNPAKVSEILKWAERQELALSQCLRAVHVQSDLNMMHWSMPLLDTSSPELLLNSESNGANVKDMPTPCFCSREPANRQRTEFDSQEYFELIKITWELQFFEIQVRQVCAVDLRVYILPLLRSFLRMKLYMFLRLRHVSELGDVKEEHASEVYVLEGSQEEHPEDHSHSNVKGQPAAVDGSDVMTPYMSSCKRSEELRTAPLEVRSSGSSAIGVSNLDAMTIHGRVLEGEPPVSSAGFTDSSASQVESADAALSRSRMGIEAAIAESKAKPEDIPEPDAEPKSKAVPQSQWSREVLGGPFCLDFDMYFDSDNLSDLEEEFEDKGSKMSEISEFAETREFCTVVWLMREKCDWDNKDNGLFFCISINDVMKNCLEKGQLGTARNIWVWNTNRTWKYWHCFKCDQRFAYRKSHMSHMESHGFSQDHDWMMPFQVQQEGQSRGIEGVKERSHMLDDSITVDSTYRKFIVEIKKFVSSCQKLKLMKQNLSDVFDPVYRNEILPSVSSLLQKHTDSEFCSWALPRLNELLLSVRCPMLPDSFSIILASSGKVIISLEEYNDGVTFAYVGIRLEFYEGDLSSNGSRKIKGNFIFSGISNSVDAFQYDSNVILDEEIKKTTKMLYFRDRLASYFTINLLDKLHQFQSESRGKLRG